MPEYDPHSLSDELHAVLEQLPRPVPSSHDGRDAARLALLLEVIDHLRGERGCAFDRKQTLSGLLRDLKDEIYELEEAIECRDNKGTAREIGDLVLVLLFMRRILWESEKTTFSDIAGHVAGKMIRRHPHVFRDPRESIDARELWETWEHEKRKEAEHSDRTSILDGIPRTMPALEVAFKQGQKAGRVGFDWTDEESVWEKVIEEVGELSEARTEGLDRLLHEIGDLLLAVTAYARHVGIRSEDALGRANQRFDSRFRHMERKALEDGRTLASLSAVEWDALWEEAKAAERKSGEKPGSPAP